MLLYNCTIGANGKHQGAMDPTHTHQSSSHVAPFKLMQLQIEPVFWMMCIRVSLHFAWSLLRACTLAVRTVSSSTQSHTFSNHDTFTSQLPEICQKWLPRLSDRSHPLSKSYLQKLRGRHAMQASLRKGWGVLSLSLSLPSCTEQGIKHCKGNNYMRTMRIRRHSDIVCSSYVFSSVLCFYYCFKCFFVMCCSGSFSGVEPEFSVTSACLECW